MTPFKPELTYPAVAAAVALIGSVTDIKSRRIPNLITFPAFLFGLVLHLALSGWVSLLTSLAAGVICGVVFLIFYIAGGMGAGDVKLVMAVGCIAGLSHVAYLLVLTALCGGVMAVVVAVARGRLQQTLANVGAIAAHHAHEGLQAHPEFNLTNTQTIRLPYAVAIAGGSLLTFWFQVQ